MVKLATHAKFGATYARVLELSKARLAVRAELRRVPALRKGGNQNLLVNDPKYKFMPKCVNDEDWEATCGRLRAAWAAWDADFVQRGGRWVDDMAARYPKSVIPPAFQRYVKASPGGGYERAVADWTPWS